MTSPKGRSLLRPLLVLSVVGPLALALLIATIQSVQQTSLLRDLTLKHLREVAAAVVDSDLPRDFRDIAKRTRTEILLLDQEGVVIADSTDRSVGQSVATETDVYLARNYDSGAAHVRRGGVEYGAVTLKLDASGEPPNYMRVMELNFGSDDHTGFVPGRMMTAGWFWLCLVGGTLLFWAVAHQLSRRIRRPLQQVTNALDQLGELTWEGSVDVTGRGEIEQLSEAFNRAAESIATEVQNLKRQSTDLEQTAHFLETVLGAMVEGVIAVDPRHCVMYANQAAVNLLASRFKPNELPGRQLLEMARHQSIDRAVRRALAGERRVRLEFELPASGRFISLLATQLVEGSHAGAVLVLHDVTDLRRLERLRREFVSNVSHELKTPLAAIQGYVETLLDGAVDDPNVNRRFLTGVATQGNRLHAMIQDLLQLGRIEAGNEAFNIQDVGISSIITSVVEENRHVAEAKGLRCEVEPPANDIIVRADAKALRTIIENLLTNAVKYTATGTVRIAWRAERRQLRIDVSDTGVGIAREHQPRIFERFYRVDEARSRDAGGTGLGLAIVKHLCQVFGGRVNLHSEVGKGSTFSVFLPMV